MTRHRDVAICDGCGALVLGYGDENDYLQTVEELTADGTAHQTARIGDLWIIAKTRSTG